MIELVVSGGQTGADQAGWRAARAAGIPTAGWMPRGYLTEDGPRPEFAGLYGARETLTADHVTRTRLNVEMADVTAWFGSPESAGARCTFEACRRHGRPMIHVGDSTPHAYLLEWIAELRMMQHDGGEVWSAPRYRTLNVAGNRESRAPGIGEWVERYLIEVFRLMRGEG